MEINSAFDAGVAGLQRAENSIAESSQRIAELNIRQEPQPEQTSSNQAAEPVNLTEEAVNLRVQELSSEANASVIKTADDVVGTLIDLEV